MVDISHNPDRGCEEHDRINECGEEPPFYKVPFIYGPEPRLAMEWQCEECIVNGEVFTLEEDEVFLEGMPVEEVEERYLDGENPDEFIPWSE